MNNIDYNLEYSKAMDKMAKGGEVKALFKMDTPTGEPSKLTYIQQLLVRTKAFKEWFGDWESFANKIIYERINETPASKVESTLKEALYSNDESNGNLTMNQKLLMIYFDNLNIEDVSYTIDYETLEPQAYWHGTKSEEFYEFKTNVRNTGRPYSYFAVNKEYSENFSQGKTLYSVFTCIKNPYIKLNIKQDVAEFFLVDIFVDYGLKNGISGVDLKKLFEDSKYNYVKKSIVENFPERNNVPFWMLMARDNDGQLKRFLQELGYDGVMYMEEFVNLPDLTNKQEITRAVTIFEPNQVKLADGRNTEFSALNNDIRYEKGGLIAPNGNKSNLTPEQYKLVRTPEFKKWFGDWENDPKNASQVVDENGEPLVVYHGTDEEFNAFSYNKIDTGSNAYKIFGFYFTAINPKRKSAYGQFVKSCFLNIRKQIILPHPTEKNVSWETKPFTKSQILSIIGDIKPLNEKLGSFYNKENLINILVNENKINNQIIFMWYNFFGSGKVREGNELFLKHLTQTTEYDGAYMPHSKYLVAFHPNQIKLADGTNTTFDNESNDIRYAQGGSTKMNRYSHLHGMFGQETPKFAEGGSVATAHGITNNGKKGGYFDGRSHAEGGIKAWNSTTNSPIEVEGGEVIITKKAVEDDELYEFEGEMLTNRQILSKINESGGGVKFEDGGEIHQCNCSGKMYKFGGETMEDYQIMNKINSTYNKKQGMKNHKTSYGHNLMRKMKEGGYC
jgi:hypothetical protein